MDAADIALIVVGIVGAVGIIGAAFVLDRRSQRARSESWMRNWAMLTRVRKDLFNRLYGPRRLEDHRPDASKPKRKAATPRRKRSRKPTR